MLAGRARSRSSLATASSAPAASAAAALSLLWPTYDDSTMIGMGRVPMMISTAVRPSMPGSSMSIVMRSGRSLRIAASASSALPQTLITLMSPSYSSVRRSAAAYIPEFSQISTLAAAIASPPQELVDRCQERALLETLLVDVGVDTGLHAPTAILLRAS